MLHNAFAHVFSFLSQPIALAVEGVLLLALVGFLAAWRYRYVKYFRPKRYFVRLLTSEQLNALKHAAVPFNTAAVNPGEEGILIPQPDFKRALKALRARVVERIDIGNRIEETVLAFALQCDPALQAFQTTLHDTTLLRWYQRWYYSLRYGRKILDVVRDGLMPSVKTDIRVHMTRGGVDCPVVDESFHVFLYAAPADANKVRPPGRLLGLDLARTRGAFGTSGQGVPIIDETSQFAIAELVDNCLYVSLDVTGTQWKTRPDLGLLVRVLQKVDEELIADKFLAEIVERANAEHPPLPEAPDSQPRNVSSEGFGGRRQTVLTSLVRDILLPAVHADVLVKQCAGSNQPPIEDGTFRIFFHASPMGSMSMETPERIWGYRLLKRGQAFVPSAMGVPIIDDAGFIVGELVGNNLYLHQEYIHYGSKIEAAMVARLLLEVRKELHSARNATAETLSRKLADHFADECSRQMKSCAARGLKATTQEMTKARNNLREVIKNARLAEGNLLRLQAAPSEELGREYDELLKLANVIDVRVSADTLVVVTKTLNCVHPKTKQKHEIGAFEIHISMRYHTIKWYNQTRKVQGGRSSMNAPHVDENGNACFGNTKELFPMLISKREFASAVELAIAFVESVNLDDTWGKHIVSWPVVAE